MFNCIIGFIKKIFCKVKTVEEEVINETKKDIGEVESFSRKIVTKVEKL